MIIEQDLSERRKKRERLLHKGFLIFNMAIVAISMVSSFIFIGDNCGMAFFLYLTIFYIGQSIQHYLILKMPQIDIIKYQAVIKRFLVIVSAIEISYFFLAFMFWTKFEVHPLYCFLCQKLGLPIVIGIAIMVHFVVSLLFFIHFLHGFIKRKYYLMALGGFEVQQRLNRQRQQHIRRVGLIEPYYNDYPLNNENVANPNQYYEFQDVNQDYQTQKVCSICLTKNKEGFHPILTPCKHYFHRQCIEDWARINSRCPQCRAEFKQINIEGKADEIGLEKIDQVEEQGKEQQLIQR